MSGWALRLPIESAASLGELRLTRDLQIRREGESLWLLGAELNESLELRLREIPGAERFEVLESNELVPHGALVPLGYLPSGAWSPINEYLRPQLSESRQVAPNIARASLTLASDAAIREPAAILTSLTAWRDYLETAPQVRLSRLKFLADRAGRVFVVGQPLPPLPGERYWETSGIYVAAGFAWQPRIDAVMVRRALELADDSVAIWHADGCYDVARHADFAPARRSAGAATQEAIGHG